MLQQLLKPKGKAKSIELTTKAKNDAIVATAKAQADATKTRAEAEKYRIDTVQTGLKNADNKYFQNQSINAFTELAKSDTNTIVVSNDQVGSFGQLPVVGQLLNSGTQKIKK